MSNKIISLKTTDVRFPTSDLLDGSDATNKDPDYSAAYLELETERGDVGNSLIFTIGRGNDICCDVVEAMGQQLIGRDLDTITADMGLFYREINSDSQLNWLGPHKGVVHMAAGSIINAVWDLWARVEGKPLWRLLADMSPEEFVNCLDFKHIGDALTRNEALAIVQKNTATRQDRIAELEKNGYPAYTTTPGWLGYSDEKMQRLCREALAAGFKHIKLKVGESIEQDIHRCTLAREAIGDDTRLMVDANQAWEVDQAIEWMEHLQPFKPWFIEEPTSPDDVFGHKKIRESIGNIQVATGEHCHNKVMFKQFIANDAIDVVQVDACRLAGLNEILTVFMLAAKYGKPVCPHAGGVGLCEYVQHLSMIDYVQISAEIGERVIEYADHLHEHFETPIEIKNGAYRPPSAPGFGVRMHQSAIDQYQFPDGSEWQKRLATGPSPH